MENDIEIKSSKRGVVLWVVLVIFIVGCLLRLISLLLPTSLPIYSGGPSWDYSFNVFAFVIEAGGITGIIIWRRWGIYLMTLAYIAEVFVDFVYYTPRPSILEGLLNFVLFLFLLWAVKRKWQFFK
jgi:hypothetical protein